MSKCHALCLEEHRQTMHESDNADVLYELRRAWTHPPEEEPTECQRQDWSSFRAITLREARRRGLVLSCDTCDLLEQRGIRA